MSDEDAKRYIKIFTSLPKEEIEALIAEPDAMTEPWYGQLMRGPQVLAYLIQLDRWFKKYHVELI